MASLHRVLVAAALALACLCSSTTSQPLPSSTEVDPGWPGSLADNGWEVLSSNVGAFVAVNSSYTVRRRAAAKEPAHASHSSPLLQVYGKVSLEVDANFTGFDKNCASPSRWLPGGRAGTSAAPPLPFSTTPGVR